MGRFKSLGGLEVLEIIQVGTIMFMFAMLGAFVLSLIFTEIDKLIDKQENEGLYTTYKFIETYVQLLLTAILYFYIEQIAYLFPSIANMFSKTYPAYKSINYAVHILLILILIEMNPSLVDGVHFIQKKLHINAPPKDDSEH